MVEMRRSLVAALTLATLALSTPVAAASSAVVPLYVNGVASARFGQSTSVAMKSLERYFGVPQTPRPVDFTRNCNIDADLRWPTLSVFFFRGRFVGYGYTTRTNMGYGTSSPRRRVVASTAQGLKVGDPLSRARSIYTTRFVTSSAQSGTWSVSTPAGTFRGYLTGEPNVRQPVSRIATIGAGSVGCPAVSP